LHTRSTHAAEGAAIFRPTALSAPAWHTRRHMLQDVLTTDFLVRYKNRGADVEDALVRVVEFPKRWCGECRPSQRTKSKPSAIVEYKRVSL
jgi:hypothetical protein